MAQSKTEWTLWHIHQYFITRDWRRKRNLCLRSSRRSDTQKNKRRKWERKGQGLRNARSRCNAKEENKWLRWKVSRPSRELWSLLVALPQIPGERSTSTKKRNCSSEMSETYEISSNKRVWRTKTALITKNATAIRFLAGVEHKSDSRHKCDSWHASQWLS